MAKKNNSSEDTTPENLDPTTSLPQSTLNRLKDANRMTNYLVQNPNGVGPIMQGKLAPDYNIQKLRDLSYDLNDQVEGGEYQDEKVFKPFKSLSEIDTRRDLAYQSRLAELGFKENTLAYEQELDDNQAWYEEIANAQTKFMGKLFNYTTTGLAGIVYGLGKAATTMDAGAIIDNEVFRAMDDMDDWLNKRFVIHGGADYRQAQERGEWFGNRFLINPLKTVGDDITDAAAFVGSAILTETAAGLATAASGGFGSGALAANTMKVGITGARLWNRFAGGVKVLRGLDVASDIAKSAKVIQQVDKYKRIAGTARGIMTGAGMESAMIGRDTQDQTLEQLLADHKKQYGRPPTASERARYENTAENAGLNAYLLNLPLVAGSNMLQFPKIFLKGYGSSRKVMKGLELAGGKWGPKYDKLSRAGKIGYWGKKSLGTGITEGFEEFAQGAIEDGLIDYYGSNYSPLATKEGVGYLDAMSTAAYKYAGTTEGIDSMTIGFLMGMIGMPMPTNFKTGKKTKLGKIAGAFEWHGGAFGEIKEARREIKEVRKAAEKLNNTDAGTALQESYQNFVRNIQIENDKDEAIASGDIFEYKNKEHDSLFSYTMSRFNIGLEDTIFQELDALEKMSTEDFNKNYGIKGLEEWDDNSKRETLTKARQKITDILEVTTNTQTIMDSKFGNVKPEDAPMYRGLRDQLIYTAAAVQNANSREQELNRQITDRSWEGINTSRLDEATFKLDKKSAKEGYVEFKEEYDKIMDEEMDNWKKNNPATYSINNQLVKDLYQDLKKLKIRRNSAAELFEFLMTPKGTKLFNEFDAKVKEKQAELLKEYTEQKTKENLEKAQNQKEVNRVKKDAESNGTVNAVNEVKESEANKISDQIDKKRTAEEQAIAELEAELMDEMVPPEGAPVGDLKDLASQKEDNKDPNDALKSMVDTAATDRSIKGQEAIDYIVAENAKVLLNSILETVGVNYDISDINSVADLGSAAIAMKDSERWAAIQVAAIEEVEALTAKRKAEAEQRAQKRINESELEDTTKDNSGVDGPSVNIAETQKDTSTEDDANNGLTFLDELSSENPGGTLGLQVTDETIILITHDKEFKEGLKEKKSTVIDETTGKPKENPFKEKDEPRLDSDLLNNPNFLPARETNEEDVEVTISSLNNDWNNKEKNQTAELMAFGVFKDGVYLGMLPEFKPQMPEHFLALRKAAFAAHKKNKAIKHTLVEKINTRVNNARVATINPPSNVAITPPAGAPIKNSPVDVIEQAKQEGATFVTKDGKEIELDLWLISKISDNGAGVIKDNNLPKEVKDAIKDLNPDRLTTGMVYMLVPHPKGLFPIRLFSNTFQDSDEAFKRHLNESLKELKNAAIEKKIEEFNKVKARLEGYFHKISFNYDPNIGYLISSQNPVTTNKWGGNILPNSSSSKPIDVFKALKDEILKVGFKAMNKSNNNAKYSKNGFISTDVFSQNGNFFHSSGFVLDSYSEPEAIELVDKVENAVQVEQQIDANNTISAKNKIINDVPTPRKESVLTEKQAKDVEAGKKVSAAAIKKVQEKALKGEDELTSAEEKVLKDNPIEEFEISKEEILSSEPTAEQTSEVKRKKRKKGKSIIPLTDTNNADSSTLRERSLGKVDGTKFNEQEEVAWLKDKLGKQVVENTTMFNSIEDLQKYLPEEVYSMLLNARKNGRNLHGLFSTAALYLNRNAFEGTAYHEAFHIVFHLALPVEQRLALIKEAREKYKDELEENASEIQVEEVLADKFMEYVQSKEASKKGLPSKIKDFFKRMYRMIKTFFNGESNVSINEVFENIQLGLYKNKPKFQNTNLTQLATGSFRTALREETYDNVNEEQQALNYLRNRYFKLVDQLKKTTHKKKKTKDLRTRAEVIAQVGETYLDNLLLNDVLNNIDNWNDEGNENLIKLGENLERVLLNNSFEDNYSETTKDLKPKESAKLSKEEVEDLTLEGGFDFSFGKGLPEFMRKFHRYLALDGLKFQDNRITTTIDTYETDQISNEDEESTQEENWFKSHIEINPEDSASQELRYFLNSIPKYDSTRKDAKIVYDAFGEEIREDSSKVFKYLAEKITNTTEGPDQMMDKLEALKNSKPYIRPIIEKLNDPKNAGIKSDMYIYLASKQYIKFLTVLEDNGVFKSFYSNRKSTDYLIAEELVSNFLNEKNKLFQDKKVGTRKQKDFEKINITEAKKFKTSIKQILDKVSGLKSGKKEEDLFTKKFSNNKTFIENIALELSGNKKQGNYGFNLTAEDLQKLYVSYDNESAITNFRRFLEKIDKVADQLVAGNNPFLLLKAQDEVDKTTVSSSVVERLAEDYKRIFAGEVQSSSRNVDNKTVYNVQLANFLSRTVAKWKDGNLRTDFMTFVSEDPLLNKSPLLKDLQNNPDLVDQMEVVLLDGLKREGKSTGTKYTRLSPIEYEATAMAAFRYAGSTYGYYKMPIPADAPTMPFIKLEKYSEEEVIDRLTDVAEGEYYRINKLRNLPTNSKLRNIKNYVKNGTKFSLLTFLNDEVNTSKPFNKTAVRESIKTFLNDKTDNGYLGSQLKALKDKKVIENYDLKTGKIVFSEGVIDSRETNKLEFIKSYLFNSLYVNTQMTSLLATDPAFYSGTVDYQKRYKQVIGPKLYLDPSKVRPNYYIKAMKDEKLPSKKETAEAVQELLKNSSLSKQEQKEITAIWSFTEDVHNTTDAQTYLHPRRYKEVMEGLNRWSDEMEAGYKRILAGKDIAEDIALFPPIKPFMFTQNKIEGTVVGMQVKNSEAMLTPSLALQKDGKGQFKYPDLAKVYQTLNTATTLKDGTKIPGIDALVFESAIKNGLEGIAPADKDGKPVLATIDNIGEAPIISLKNSDWGLQQETPAHYLDDLNNYGTQFRNLIIADLNMEGIYIIEGKEYTGKEVAELYQDTIITDLEQSYEKVEKLFLDKNGDVNYAAILDKLQSEIDRRDLGDDARAALDYYVKENPAGLKQLRPTLPLYHPVHTIMIQNILNGIFNKSITKQTTSGGAVVNTSSYGISDSLNFDPKTGTYEVLMPWTSKKYFPKDANGNIDLSKLPDEIKELVGYRIPTEDKYSMFKMKIVGFTPASMGGTLILPREATTIAGLDFDIDKLYIITPAFKVKKNGNIIYKKPINKNTPTAEAALQIFEDTAILERFLNDKFDAEEVSKILEFKNKINEDIVKNKQGLKKENAALYAEIQSVKKLKSLATDESSKIAQQIKLDELYEQMAENKIDYDSALEEQYNKSPYKEILEKAVADADNIEQYNGKAERDNLKLEIIKGILSNPHTLESILPGGSFEQQELLSAKIRLLKAGEVKKANSLKGKALKDAANSLDDASIFNILYPSTQLELFERNMTGRELTGIIANQNSHHAKALFTNMKLKVPVKVVLKNGAVAEYDALNESKVNEQRVSKNLSSLLAAVVDNAKVPLSSFLNFNSFTADTVSLMTRLGIDEEVIFYLMNQPIIIQLSKTHFAEKGNLSEENLFKNIVKEWRMKLKEKGIESKGIPYELDKTALEDSLIKENQNTDDYYTTQYQALLMFSNLKTKAEELALSVQASRMDTKGLGATVAEGFVFLDKQRRLLELVRKNENSILGITETFDGTSDQRMMAKFNELGIQKPLSLMDRILPYSGKFNEETGQFELNLLGQVKAYISDQKGKTMGITEKEARLIESQYMGYIASKFPFFNNSEGERIVRDTPEKLRQYKLNNPKSKYSVLLDAIYVKDSTKKFPLPTIQYYKTGKKPIVEEQIKKTFQKMLELGTKEEKDLAFDLIKYAYHTTAFEYTPLSYLQIVPTVFWTDDFARKETNKERGLTDAKGRTFNEVLEDADNYIRNTKLFENTNPTIQPNTTPIRYQEEGGGLLANHFIHQFIQNNFEREGFVKSVPRKAIGISHNGATNTITISKLASLPYYSYSDGIMYYIKRYNKLKKKMELFSFYTKVEDSFVYKKVDGLGATNFLKVYNAGQEAKGWLQKVTPATAAKKGPEGDIEAQIAKEIEKQAAAEAAANGLIVDSQNDIEGQSINFETLKASLATPETTTPTTTQPVTKIISGAQTGVDQIGLEVGKGLGMKTGGTAPIGFQTEKGKDKSLAEKYGIKEITAEEQNKYATGKTDAYTARTEMNTLNSDGTVYFATNADSAGKIATERYAKKHSKPFILNPTAEQLRKFLADNNIKTLNVAGNRGSKLTTQQKTNIKKILTTALKAPTQPAATISESFEKFKGEGFDLAPNDTIKNNINIFFPSYSRKGIKTKSTHRGLISYKNGKFYNAGKEIELTKEELEYLKRVVDFRVKLEDYVIGKLEKHPDINIEEFKSDSFNKWASSLLKILDNEFRKAKKANPKGTKQEWATSWLIKLGFTQNEANTLLSEIGPTPNLFNTTEIAFLNSYRLDSDNLLDKSELDGKEAKAPFEAVDQILESISTTQPAGKVSINTTRWTKDSPKENPSTAYVFTENINSIGSTRVGGGSAVIRNNPNAIGIVTKKYYTYKENRNSSNKEQWNANFQDTDADFELFKKVNLEQFAKLDKFDSKIFPDGFANSLASVPNKFALWLQNELQTRYGLVTEVNSKGTGLISKSVQQATQPVAEETSTAEVKKEGGFNLDALKAMTSESRNSLPYTTKTKSGKTIADAGISLEAWVQMSVEEQNKHIECN